METRVTGRPFEFEAEVKTDMQGGWALIEDERPYEADEDPMVARWQEGEVDNPGLTL